MIPKTRKTREFRLKRIRLVDRELRDGGGKQKEGTDKISRGLLLLAAKDKKGESGDKGDKDGHLHPGGVFEIAQHLVRGAAAAGLARGKAPFHELGSAQEVKHDRYFRVVPPVLAGERCC